MSKKELLIGAIITFILVIWMIGISMDAIEASNVGPVISNQDAITIIGWIITIWLIGFLLLAIWAIRQSNLSIIRDLKNRFTVRVMIPGYFIVVFISILVGPIKRRTRNPKGRVSDVQEKTVPIFCIHSI